MSGVSIARKAACMLGIGMVGTACLAQRAPAIELAGIDPPSLVHGAQQVSGKGCPAVRARKPGELAPPWRAVVATISMRCEALDGPDKAPDARTETVATLKPGAAVLRGVPVIALRHSASWAHDDNRYVLAAAYADVAVTLGAYIRARCVSQAAAAAADVAEDRCTAVQDDSHGGLFVRTSELGGLWLHPDPDDARRTVLAEAWSE